VPDMRHVQIACDGPLKRRRPRPAGVAPEQLEQLPQRGDPDDDDDERQHTSRCAQHGESVDTEIRSPCTLASTSVPRTRPGSGAGWNALEHQSYGLDLGTHGKRSTRFADASKIIRSLVDAERVTYSGRYYDLTNEEVLVRPVQKRLPILIGVGGEQRTLRTT